MGFHLKLDDLDGRMGIFMLESLICKLLPLAFFGGGEEAVLSFNHKPILAICVLSEASQSAIKSLDRFILSRN